MALSSGARDKLIENQPYDESVEVSDGEDIPSTNHTPQAPPLSDFPHHPAQSTYHPQQPHPPSSGTPPAPQMHAPDSDEPAHFYPHSPPQPRPPDPQHKMGGERMGVSVQGGMRYEEEESEAEGSESEDSVSDDNPQQIHTGVYDPRNYDHLRVSGELKKLFQHVTHYTPQSIELETQLRPFIPDYIPAIGDIDAFLKVSRPDGKTESAGLVVADEPRAKQSDPTVLDLQLRTLTKQTTVKPVTVRSIGDPEKESKSLDNWIESIAEIHRQKPPTTVHYTKNMPDVEDLMQEWPAQFEEALQEFGVPIAELDCDLAQYTDIICALLDIPVHNSRIHSLHNLFSLYMEFKNSQHFNRDAPTDSDAAQPPTDQQPTTSD
ncbi:Intraflagellar transport protein 46 homolog [Geodia barretti]|uniref:Intraflagellar transport protein 46 homolog n=1 Tax=Geodia barretti TaxID=519541 RepID=A0AA35SEG3_GEOBA|nr:Intraflagellar transport protein 46 homolog [Geodia barretti]